MMPEFTLSDEHVYTLDGRVIDGTTSILDEAGLIRGGDPWFMDRGTAIHKATEFYDRGTLDENTVDPQIAGYLKSWQLFRLDQDYIPIYIELPLSDPVLLYAGTLDRLPLIDLKSGAYAPWHSLQVAAYWNLARVNGYQAECLKPMGIYLQEDGGPPKIKTYTQTEVRQEFKTFCSFLHTVRWKQEKGVK